MSCLNYSLLHGTKSKFKKYSRNFNTRLVELEIKIQNYRPDQISPLLESIWGWLRYPDLSKRWATSRRRSGPTRPIIIIIKNLEESPVTKRAVRDVLLSAAVGRAANMAPLSLLTRRVCK